MSEMAQRPLDSQPHTHILTPSPHNTRMRYVTCATLPACRCGATALRCAAARSTAAAVLRAAAAAARVPRW